MKVMNLIRRNRRSPEYSESGVGKNCLLPLACRPVLARHVAVVCRRRSPSEAVALVIRAHSVKTTAASELSLKVINTREFYIGCSGLVMIAILVEPRNRVRARTAVRWCVVMWVWRRTACWCRLPTQNASPKRCSYRRNRAQFQPVPAVHFEKQSLGTGHKLSFARLRIPASQFTHALHESQERAPLFTRRNSS